MPQLNIYLDEKTEKAVWSAARRESLSLSKWARGVLLRAAGEGAKWPVDYQDVLGSLEDESFCVPSDTECILDQDVNLDG